LPDFPTGAVAYWLHTRRGDELAEEPADGPAALKGPLILHIEGSGLGQHGKW